MPNRLLQHPRRILRLILAVALVGLCQSVRSVIGLFELVLLERGGFLEALPGFFAAFLQAKGVGCLGVEVDGCFVFFGFAAEEGEAAAGGGGLFVGLEREGSAVVSVRRRSFVSYLLEEGARVLRHCRGGWR